MCVSVCVSVFVEMYVCMCLPRAATEAPDKNDKRACKCVYVYVCLYKGTYVHMPTASS